MIIAEKIEKSYGNLKVLNSINLAINKGTITCIKGSSGAGKSTLLHMLGALDKPDAGTIIFNGNDITKYSNAQLSKFRNETIGFVFQFHHLLPEFNALENVCIPAWVKKTSKAKAKEKAAELLTLLGLKDRLLHKPNELSGGEQQRVAVARALVNNPSIILADEPTGNLDSANAAAMHNLFTELKNKYNQTFLIVTHNDSLALTADKMLFMKDGVFVD